MAEQPNMEFLENQDDDQYFEEIDEKIEKTHFQKRRESENYFESTPSPMNKRKKSNIFEEYINNKKKKNESIS